jgi:formate/nitrite transporter FocA (FNT family)
VDDDRRLRWWFRDFAGGSETSLAVLKLLVMVAVLGTYLARVTRCVPRNVLWSEGAGLWSMSITGDLAGSYVVAWDVPVSAGALRAENSFVVECLQWGGQGCS